MRVPQCRQRPRSRSQEMTGMLSRGAISVPQDGQCEGGRTMDSPRGTRQMTTLRNEPMRRPKIPQNAAKVAVTGGRLTGWESAGERPARGTGRDRGTRGRSRRLEAAAQAVVVPRCRGRRVLSGQAEAVVPVDVHDRQGDSWGDVHAWLIGLDVGRRAVDV